MPKTRQDAGRRPLALRHPRAVLGAALVSVVVLGALGLGVEGRLKPTSLRVPGTESARAADILRSHFGDSAPFAILLRGPARELDRQGPRLIVALRRDPKVTTVSPWDRGTGLAELRPRPEEALILADFHVAVDEAVTETVPRLQRTLSREVTPPVKATQSGFASISRAIQDESIDATQRGELIAIPILLVVLLLVFRSPIAASIPLAFGAVTVLSSRGLLSLLTHVVDIDGFALAVSSMMGLALGVDYALLMVSRFREELDAGAEPADAALSTRLTAGRTTIFAGSTLFIAMLVSVFLLPGSLLVSLAGTVVLVVLIAVVGSSLVGPALLVLVGRNIDRWRVGGPRRQRPRWLVVVDGSLRRPWRVGAVIAVGLLALAAPALALNTGPPSVKQLPRGDPARRDAELISDTIGPGWSAPFIVVAVTRDGTMTEAPRLRALASLQRRISAAPGVEAVIGPGAVAKRVAPLRRFTRTLVGQRGAQKLGRLAANLRRAVRGIGRLRGGLAQAAEGSGLLAGGAGEARAGAATVAAGLERARSGAVRAETALGRFTVGSRRLLAAQQKAVLGALAIKFGTRDLQRNVKANPLPRSQQLESSLAKELADLPSLQDPAGVADQQLQQAWNQLQQMTIGQGDPNYAATVAAVRQALAALSGSDPVTSAPYAPGYNGLPSGLAALKDRIGKDSGDAHYVALWMTTINHGLERLANASARLYDGSVRIKRATQSLAGGAGALKSGAGGLAGGLERLGGGAGRLTLGLVGLQGGLDRLGRALSQGFFESGPLAAGLSRAGVRITTNRRRLGRLQAESPGLFDSGYFVLSALEGAPPKQRELAGRTIDLKHGGQAALVLVIPRFGFNSPGSVALGDRLQGEAARLAAAPGVRTAVAGGSPQLNDYDRVTTTRIPLVIAVIALITFLALIVILRALPLAAIAVALNLVTVAAAFGVLTALGALPEGVPFGGHDFIDAIGAAAIFGVCFGLSIDYAVFLLMRMREAWERDHDHEGAIGYGLERTAGVITGAAAIMAAVFMAYAIAPIATVSQFGIGLTVAVLLDATVIRLILLPILMRAVGPRVWWLPGPLERMLPRLNAKGSVPWAGSAQSE